MKCERSPFVASVWVALLLLGGPPLTAQPLFQNTATPDSLDILRRARKAQRDFEKTRRHNLPTELASGRHRCDERIGRYCYWYDPYPNPAESEPAKVQESRRRLLSTLGAAARLVPGDQWINGQLVRYLAEQGLASSAVVAAQRCRAARWWCDALEGFARHVAHDYPGSDSTFARALSEMPQSERCAWNDLTLLLGKEERLYRSLRCTSRDSIAQRIWWLADPLYSHPGNDLRTEHYARHTMAHLLEDAETPEATPWGNDRRQILVRFGWPTSWSRPIIPGALEQPPILGHEPGPSFWLFPAPAVADPWRDPAEVRWFPSLEDPPARYAPPYAIRFSSIERVQFARFRRGDSTLSVAVFDLTRDSLFSTRPADLRLAVMRDPTTPPAIGRIATDGKRGNVMAISPWRPAVLSLEAASSQAALVSRRRAMTPADPGGVPPDISDVLLFAPAEGLPQSLESALPMALAAPVVRRDQRLGLYWEIYAVADSSAAIDIAVTAIKLSSKREPYPVGRAWCPSSAETPVRLRWREQPGIQQPRGARSVVLDLRSLSRGRYVLTIPVSVAGKPLGCSSRELEVF